MVKNNLLITAKQLLKIRFHLGHKKNQLNSSMVPYVYGFRRDITIFDVDKIIFSIKIIFQVLQEIFAKRGTFFLASTQKDLPVRDFFKFYRTYKNEDKLSNIFIHGYIIDKWINGVFTNYFFYRKLLEKITTQEILISRDKNYLKYLEGVKEQYYFPNPDIVFLFGYNKDTCKEFNLLNIPIIGLLDTNAKKEPYTYGIPGNDDSFEVLQFFFDLIEKAEEEGRNVEKIRFFKLCLFKVKKTIFLNNNGYI